MLKVAARRRAGHIASLLPLMQAFSTWGCKGRPHCQGGYDFVGRMCPFGGSTVAVGIRVRANETDEMTPQWESSAAGASFSFIGVPVSCQALLVPPWVVGVIVEGHVLTTDRNA